jgi:myosin-crossreactive antigen
MKGEKSFWYPYLEVTKDIPTIANIDKSDLKKIKDVSLKKIIKKELKEAEKTFNKLLEKILLKYP